jgi:hypothetical protein
LRPRSADNKGREECVSDGIASLAGTETELAASGPFISADFGAREVAVTGECGACIICASYIISL